MPSLPFTNHVKVDPITAGAQVRARRERLGVKMDDLATRLGISKSLLSYLETGQRNWTPARFKQAMKELRT